MGLGMDLGAAAATEPQLRIETARETQAMLWESILPKALSGEAARPAPASHPAVGDAAGACRHADGLYDSNPARAKTQSPAGAGATAD